MNSRFVNQGIKFQLLLFVSLFFCVYYSILHAQVESFNHFDVKQNQQIDSLLTYSFKNGMFNGAIAIVRDDTVLFENTYGSKDNRFNEQIDSETLFYLASVSKQFTSMGVMKLYERGQLNYDESVVAYLPEFSMIDTNVTVRHLLNHTSGISDRQYYQLENPSNADVEKALKSLRESDFGEPGKNFAYSNSGYILLALIVEKLSGKRIGEFFQEEIFIPLGMNRSYSSKQYFSSDSNRVQAYSIIGDSATYKSSVVGPGGIYSTLSDLKKWNLGLNRYQLVSKISLQEAFLNGSLDNGPISFEISNRTFGYGFGWMIDSSEFGKIVSHDGSTDGFSTLVRKDLEKGIDIIILTNHGAAFALTEIIDGLTSIIDGGKYVEPIIPLSNMAVNDIKNSSVSVAVENLKKRVKDEGVPDERILGRLGFVYLNQGMMEEAIGLFEYNLELHPQSPNALYILGEAYISEEKFSEAKLIYERYSALRPSSKHGISRLAFIEEQLGN